MLCHIDTRSTNRLGSKVQKLTFKGLLVLFLSLFLTLNIPATILNAATSPSYKYYNNGTEIGATGGKFGDKTVSLNKISGGNTYGGIVQVAYTYNTGVWPYTWPFGEQITAQCKAGVLVSASSLNSANGSISTPSELNKGGSSIGSTGSTIINNCTSDIASGIADFNQTSISISGSLNDPTQITNTSESDDERQISVVVYSNKPAGELPKGITATLSNKGNVVATENLTFGDNLAVSNQPFFKNVDPGIYTICLNPLSTFNFDQCQTVTKVSGKLLQATFGSADTVSYKDGKVVTVTVDVKMSDGPKNGVYGPYSIDLINTTTNKIIKTTTTGKSNEISTIDGKASSEVRLTTDPNFDLIEPGDYKVCIQNTNLCTNFKKNINSVANPTITVTADKSDQLFTETLTKPTTSCGDSVPGLGWIICPIINGLTSLNDSIWGLASGLLKVNPITQSDSIYTAWGTIRNIANVAFVIVFLMIIFSQLISFGFSNYNIKKLLPRLLISAILVNISFILVQLAVDIANVLGSGLFDLFAGMAQKPAPTWGDLVSLLLASGAGAVVGGVTIFAVGGIAAAFWLILPMAVMGALGLIAAIITLIFRQAIIPILAILAPLAFVAYLLPNTEAWFKKWRELLVSMLILYPLAGMIFGGARFAASVIAENGGWFNKLIGLIMLTLPLFSLPYLASKSGALVNKVGSTLNGFANKIGKPIGDWSNKNAGYAKNQANNRAMNSTSTFGANAYRRSRLQKSARLEAIDQSQQREFNRAKTGYIASETAKESSTLRRQMVVGAAAGAADRALANANAINSKLQGEEFSAASSIQQGVINTLRGDQNFKGIAKYLKNQATGNGSDAQKEAALDLLAKNGQDGILRDMVNNPDSYRSVDRASLQSIILSNAGSLVNSAPDLVKSAPGAFTNMTGDALSKMSPTSTVAYMEYMDKLRVSDPDKFVGVAESFNSAINDIALNSSLQSVFRGNIGKMILNPTKDIPSAENPEVEVTVNAVSPDLLSQLQKGLNFIDSESGKIRSVSSSQSNSQPIQTTPGSGLYRDNEGKERTDSGIYTGK